MSDDQRFRDLDEQERLYAPHSLPIDQQDRVEADEGQRQTVLDGTPADLSGAQAEGAGYAVMPVPSITHEPNAGVPRDPAARTPDVINHDPERD